MLLNDLDNPSSCKSSWIGSFLSLTSWLFTNASSSSSGRTLSYANLDLEMMLVLVEDEHSIGILTSRSAPNVQLCSQVSIAGCHAINVIEGQVSDSHDCRLRRQDGRCFATSSTAVISGFGITCIVDLHRNPTPSASGYAIESYGICSVSEYDSVRAIPFEIAETLTGAQITTGKNSGFR